MKLAVSIALLLAGPAAGALAGSLIAGPFGSLVGALIGTSPGVIGLINHDRERTADRARIAQHRAEIAELQERTKPPSKIAQLRQDIDRRHRDYVATYYDQQNRSTL
jgi:hypothetical protein